MQEFQELIKNFSRVRDYMRQFFIYGFKSRADYGEKSSRTYDNERRRIESWLSPWVTSGYTARGKQVSITVDSMQVPENPLYAAWKSKGFTDNDLALHFLLPDLLTSHPQGLTVSQLCDLLAAEYGALFDSQTVRLKCREYETAGMFLSSREGKRVTYRLAPPLAAETAPLWKRMTAALSFFQGAAPFGFIGSTLLDRENASNRLFQFKHQFIVHTLEDGILAQLLDAIQSRSQITCEYKSSRTGRGASLSGIPLKIFVSTQTGRRYLCYYQPDFRRLNTARLDGIVSVTVTGPAPAFEQAMAALHRNESRCWGVSFGKQTGRQETVAIRFAIDEATEGHILHRLEREGRGGEVSKIRDGEYLYYATFFDTNEMLSWIKSFTGRILDIQGTNETDIQKLIRDWERMYRMYGPHTP